ncbi:MAG: pitrilysin family protein [Clostridia bacterium]
MEKIIKFNNGLKLVLNQNLGMYSVTTGMWVEAGCAFENSQNNGISHFIEHNLFKGTTTRSSFEISDCIDRTGGQINAFTSKEATCYYVKSTNEHLPLSLELLSDLLLNSKFDESEMDKERGVILEEIAMVEDTPDDLCMDLLSKAYFKDKPLGQTILGTAENIKSITRQNVLDFMAKTYTPNNIVISIAGNFDIDETILLVEKFYVKNMQKPCVALPELSPCAITSGFESKEKDIEQCHIGIAFPSIKFNDEKVYEHNILNNIFGGGMSSRLFQNIREDKGLAYNVFSFNSQYKDNGSLVIYAGVNPKNVELATKAIKEEIVKFKKDGISMAEFERGKAQTIGNFVFAQENTAGLMSIYGKCLLFDKTLFNIEQKLEKMRKIQFEEVNSLAKDTMNFDQVCASLVGKNSNLNLLSIIKD